MSPLQRHPHCHNDYKSIAIVITLYLLVGCGGSIEPRDEAPSSGHTTLAESLAEAEQLFYKRGDIDNLRKAVSRLAAARDPNERSYEVEWKFAKYSYFLGKAEQSQQDSISSFEKGRDAARIAHRLQPDKPEGHFWFGANLGELARINPLTVGLQAVDEIRTAMHAVLSSNPGYQGASAYDALGQLEMATRTLKGGTLKKAIEYFETGLSVSPENANLRVNLAEAYLVADNANAAREQLDALFKLPPDPLYTQEHEAAVAKGKVLMSRYF